MKKQLLIIAMLFAISQLTFAQSNNTVNVFQGGVNFSTFESNNSEVEISQLGSSGTTNSDVTLQQVGELQKLKVQQTNVIDSRSNTAQGGSDNSIDITQIDGNDLYMQIRQFGTGNETVAGHTGDGNYAVSSQSGDDNYAIISQGGVNNHTIAYGNLSSSTLDFLNVTGTFTGDHDPGGTGLLTDGILQYGNDNLASFSQLGTNNGGFLYQEGDDNSGAILQSGSDNQAFNLQRGNENVANITQDGATASKATTMQGSSDEIATGNVILATQSEGANMYLGARQDGAGNMATLTQSNNDNRLITAQDGNENEITATQSGSANYTIAYSDLNELHTAFLDQHDAVTPKFSGEHKFDGDAQNTDGIIQYGDSNEVVLDQTGDENGVFLYQDGMSNSIQLTQISTGDQACIMQRGNGNKATIDQ